MHAAPGLLRFAYSDEVRAISFSRRFFAPEFWQATARGLIARRGQRFVVRERREIERLFSRAFDDASAVERIMPGLGTIAAALNAGDRCLACIAAVHLRIPDLPDVFARQRMEAEDG